MGGGSRFGMFPGCLPVGSGYCRSPLPASASSRLRPWRQARGTRVLAAFGCSALPATPGKPRPARCGNIGASCSSRWVAPAGGKLSGQFRLTSQSSRYRFAVRLISSVRRHWGKVGRRFLLRHVRWLFAGRRRMLFFGAACIGEFVASALASGPRHSGSCRLRLFRASSYTGQASSSALWRHRLVMQFKVGGIGWRQVLWPFPPNKSIKPTCLRHAAYF